MTNHIRRPIAEYESLLRRKREQGLTFTELSKRSGVPVCTLQYWAKKLKGPKLAATDTGAFVQLNSPAPNEAALELVLDPTSASRSGVGA